MLVLGVSYETTSSSYGARRAGEQPGCEIHWGLLASRLATGRSASSCCLRSLINQPQRADKTNVVRVSTQSDHGNIIYVEVEVHVARSMAVLLVSSINTKFQPSLSSCLIIHRYIKSIRIYMYSSLSTLVFLFPCAGFEESLHDFLHLVSINIGAHCL